MGMTHSEGLMPQLEQLLTRTEITKNEIDLLAVSMGPGSFTGLRIGLASAEAMAYSWHKPICGVNTLKALAYNLPIDGYVLSPVLDAQKGNFYQAIYEWQPGDTHRASGDQSCRSQADFGKYSCFGYACFIIGRCQKIDLADLPSWCRKAPAHLCWPQAASVALLAEAEYDPDNTGDIFGLEPYYIRRSEAEELWEKRQQE